MVIFSIVSSMIVGIIGIIFDRRKLLAIIATIVAGGLVLFCLFMMAVSIFFMMSR
jgi:hypothetical protein